ncbi:hypothetical protein KOR34_18810 [Posidoniimonas corsicana]|uniref:Tellurite resistance protein TerB n=1 Tax=Posidoniimonas corsicana TaxID=1938618 RepID=A0A5C5VE83_9BACT|nr:hypothetical protein [Posidoniimonas corsicana]TWT36936.1 hypothetical protein KOR34_18810 [Posidoniimonas corsicana]
MNVDSIATALIETCVFFATSEEDLVDPDTAVEQLEHIAAHLKNLDDLSKERFLAVAEELAVQAELTQGNSQRVKCLRALGANLGLSD